MKFVKFPNGKVWRVSDDNWIEGTVRMLNYEQLVDSDARIEAVSTAITGSMCGLGDYHTQYHGFGVLWFSGCAEELPDDEADYEGNGFKLLALDSPELAFSLGMQYGLTKEQVDHALSRLGHKYEAEVVIPFTGSQRKIHVPANPEPFNYVRIAVDGLELAHWRHVDLNQNFAGVMETMLKLAGRGAFRAH